MSTVRRAESPTAGEWTLAAGAALLGAIFTAGMVYFAIQTNHHAQLLNWFGLAAAIMGAAIFELLKYAATTRRRHIDNLATLVAIVPEKIKELAAVTEQIKHSRQMQDSIATFVELRARELMAEQTKTQLVARVAQVKNDLDDLTALEQALALDQQHAETNELAAEMRAMMESLDPTAKAQRWVHRAATLPFVSPWIGRATEGLLQDIQIQLSARRTRQARTRTAAMRTPATQNATSEPPSGPNATPEPAPIHLLVGPAGVGKTRLAVQLPLELNHRHRLHTGYIRFTPRTV